VILVWVVDFLVAFNLSCNPSCIVSCVTFSLTICQLSITSYLSGLFSWSYIHKSCLFKLHGLLHMFIELIFFFLDSRKPHPPESALYGPRWASKTPAVPGSYKRCTPWLELETWCADLKPFVITLRPLGTYRVNPVCMFLLLYMTITLIF
jgi:hypothetical protein